MKAIRWMQVKEDLEPHYKSTLDDKVNRYLI